jgi:hypothetical protein
LSVAFGAVARLRAADKPLHPRGRLTSGTVTRQGLDAPVGVPWIDEPGSDTVTVRLSRSVGLPAPLPDVHGLAVRVPVVDGHADLLLATTGRGRIGRFVFRPSVDRSARVYTTLLPYRTSSGPLLVAAFPTDSDGPAFDLACASLQGAWRTFAHLEIGTDHHEDPTVSFDPVLNTLPGLDPYGWVASLREGSYVAARRARGAPAVIS